MKKAIQVLALVGVMVSCQPKVNSEAEVLLRKSLKQKKYFELRNQYNQYKHEISDPLKLELDAHLFNVFNKNEKSNKAAEILLKKYGTSLSDTLKATIAMIEADNNLKLFRYKEALFANNKVLELYKNAADSSMLDDAETMKNIYEPLQNTAPQRVIIKQDNVIPIKRDVAGLMNVEVLVKGKTYDFIFDTGAGMPVIKKSFAEQLNIPILETSINVKAATGKTVNSTLAVIDSLQIGNILVLNSVFLVMEDEMLEFPQINFFPLAAIGFPIMEEFKEFTITQSDTLLVPQKPTHRSLSNMRLNGLSPNVYFYNGSDTLEYAFDTGATQSHFTQQYFEKYKDVLENTAKPDSVRTSSAGGSKMHATRLMDSTELFIANKRALLTNIHVHTNHNNTFNDVYGNLGQDLIRQFKSMTLNFDDMYIIFE